MKLAQRIPNKKIITAIIIIVTALVIGAFAYNRSRSDSSPAKDDNNTGSSPIAPDKDDIKYEPATDAEKAETERYKQELDKKLEEQKNQNNTPTTGIKQVEPMLATLTRQGQQVVVSAYINGLYEEGGNCTLTARKGSTSFTRSSTGTMGASKTDCAPFFVNVSDFNSLGEWEFTVLYESSTARGISQVKKLELK